MNIIGKSSTAVKAHLGMEHRFWLHLIPFFGKILIARSQPDCNSNGTRFSLGQFVYLQRMEIV